MNETQLSEVVEQLLLAVSAAAIDAAAKAYIAVKDVNANYAPAYAAAFTAANIAAAKAYPSGVGVNIALMAHSHAITVFEDKEIAAKTACDAAYANPQNVSCVQAANLSLVEAAAASAVAEVLNARISNAKSSLKDILNVCGNVELKEWCASKSWQEIYKICHRGEWLLLLFKLANPNDIQLLTLTKGHCANTIRHLIKDRRSISVIDAAILYGVGELEKDQFALAALEAVEDAKTALSTYVGSQNSRSADAIVRAADLNTIYSAAQAAYTVAADAFSVTADTLSSAANTAICTANAVESASLAAVCHAAIEMATNAINSRNSKAYAAALDSANSTKESTAAKIANELQTANIIRKYIPFEKWNILQ